MNQVKFVEGSFSNIWSNMVCLDRQVISNFLKDIYHKFYLVHSWIPWPKLFSISLMRKIFIYRMYLVCNVYRLTYTIFLFFNVYFLGILFIWIFSVTLDSGCDTRRFLSTCFHYLHVVRMFSVFSLGKSYSKSWL